MSDNARERYLRFLAHLYDFAADFDPPQLDEIRRVADGENRKLVWAVAALLMELRSGQRSPRIAPANTENAVDSAEGLQEALSSKKIFPSNRVLLAFVGPHVELHARPKEPRDRLVRRIVQAVETGSLKDKAEFHRTLAEYIREQGKGSDFVSRWTKIIRGL